MLTPTIDPCLNCLELSRVDDDEAWPAIASQLLVSEKRFDDGGSVLFAAALAMKRILQLVDRKPAQSESVQSEPGQSARSTALFFDAASGEISETSWGFHSDCLCRFSVQ
jgi:hypothetical protein